MLSSHFGTCQFVLPSPPPVNPLTPTTPQLTVNLQLQLDWAMAASRTGLKHCPQRITPYPVSTSARGCPHAVQPHIHVMALPYSQKLEGSAWTVEQKCTIKDHIINPTNLSSSIIWIWKYSAPVHNHLPWLEYWQQLFQPAAWKLWIQKLQNLYYSKRIMKTMRKPPAFHQ